MTEVTRQDVAKAVRDLGIKEGDVVLVHSSFKSMGHVVGGAEDVITGFLDVIGDIIEDGVETHNGGIVLFADVFNKGFE